MKGVKRGIVFLFLVMFVSILPGISVMASGTESEQKPYGPSKVDVYFDAPGQFKIEWSEVNYKTNVYQVDRRESVDGIIFGKWEKVKQTDSTSIIDGGFEYGMRYQYRVRAKDNSNNVWSIYTKSKVLTYKTADSPSEVNVELVDNVVKVTWPKVDEAYQYCIFRKEFVDEKWSEWTLLTESQSTEYKDKSVKCGVIYVYGIQSYNHLGLAENVTNSGVIEIPFEKPDAPSEVKAKLEKYAVKVTWSEVPSAEKYVVYRSECIEASWSNWEKIGKTESTEFIDSNIGNEKVYKYKVYASNSAGLSKGKTSGKVIIPNLLPNKPKDITATMDNDNGIILSWPESENAEGYIIYRQTAGITRSEFTKKAKYKEIKTAGFIDDNVQCGCKYKYFICAYNDMGNSEESDPIEVNVYMINISSKIEKGRAIVTWPQAGSAEKYQVYRREFDGKKWTSWELLETTETTTYFDTKLKEGSRYQYLIKAFYGDFGWGGEVISTRIVAENLLPSAPENVTASPDNNEAKISWSEVENAEKYRIYRKEFDGTAWSKWKRINETASTYYKDGSIQFDKKYKYRVYSFNYAGLGKSNDSDEIIITLPKPSEPESVTATAENNIVTVEWSSVETAVKYRVYRREYGENEWSSWVSLTDTTSLSFMDTNVIEGKKYNYSVKAYNKSGWGKLKKSNILVIPYSKIDAPAEVVATVNNNEINVAWSEVERAEKYRVYRKEYDGTSWGDWKKITDTSSLEYTDASVTIGRKYKYAVRGSYNGILGEKKDSNSIVIPLLKPVAPESVTATVENNAVIISWSVVEGANKYRVYRKEYDGTSWGSWEKLTDTPSLSYIDSTIETGKKYRYCVRAYNEAGWGDKKEAKTVKIPLSKPDEPSTIQVKEEDNMVVITWSEVKKADKYRLYRRELNGSNWSEWKEINDTFLLSYTDRDIRYGNTYQYAVSAGNEGGWSDLRISSSILPYGPRFSYPDNIWIKDMGDYYKVSWNHVEGEPVYYFQYQTTQNEEEPYSEWSEIIPQTTDFNLITNKPVALIHLKVMVFDSVTNQYYDVMEIISVG